MVSSQLIELSSLKHKGYMHISLSLTILLMHHRLAELLLAGAVIMNPLDGPVDGLAPPVRIRMKRSEIDVLQRQFRVEIAAVRAVVRPVVGDDVEASLAAGRHEMVRVQRLDVGAHLVDPRREEIRSARVAAWQVAGGVCAAARLVGELPGHDGGGGFVAGDQGLDVALVCGLDLGEAVELDLESVCGVSWRESVCVCVREKGQK